MVKTIENLKRFKDASVIEPKRCHDLRRFDYACAKKPGLKCKECRYYHNHI